jgi:putative IMPACT (imprinted ancient) family translation regulator
MARLGLHCDFAELALMKARLKELGAQFEQEDFGTEGVLLRLSLPAGRVDEARARIIDISRGRSEAYDLE